MSSGTLYIVATPIGNLGDITLRALETLKAVDRIAAEDTRHTQKLLNHYQIDTRTISYHEHSDPRRLREIIYMLEEGQMIALVSDAGTPLIADPGHLLVKECVKRGITVESLPGPSAAIAALSVSGLAGDSFVFAGFMPTKQKARKEELEDIASTHRVAVLYESPNRVLQTLRDIADVFGEQTRVCVARELTKIYEEVLYGTVEELLQTLDAKKQQKGEFVIVIAAKEPEQVTDERIVHALKDAIQTGMTKKDAVAYVAASLDTQKNRVYQLSLDL